MAQNSLKQNTAPPATARLKLGVAAAMAVAFAYGMIAWGGGVSSGKLAAFWLGIAVLAVTLCAFAYAFWVLLVRPLPVRHRIPVAAPVSATYRQAIALLLGISGISIVVGGFWDELWHRVYGLPFGDDFFWRPHLLMYFGFVAIMVLGAAGAYRILWQMEGTLAQRFRAVPTIGLLVLVSAFMLYALPADPIWHFIYGADLTAWSIPHLLLLLSFTTIMLVAVAIQLSMIPVRPWQSVARLTAYDILPLIMFACIILVNLQIFTTEYDEPVGFMSQLLRSRPEWVLPFLIAGIATWIGVTANQSLRYFGAATLSGLLALALRVALINLFDAEVLSASGPIAMLSPLLVIDLWYAYCAQRQHTPHWIGGGIAGAVGLLTSYPLLLDLYPHLAITNYPLMGIMVLVAGLSASWIGAQLGDYLATSHKQVRRGGVPLAVPLTSAGALVALALFILFFVKTAVPPV